MSCRPNLADMIVMNHLKKSDELRNESRNTAFLGTVLSASTVFFATSSAIAPSKTVSILTFGASLGSLFGSFFIFQKLLPSIERKHDAHIQILYNLFTNE